MGVSKRGSAIRYAESMTALSIFLILAAAGRVFAQATAVSPYTIKVFATSQGSYSKPDDLAVSPDGKDLWVGFGNGNAPDGSDGKSSNILEYDIASGTVLQNVSIPGHVDGLKINPSTGDAWTMENEDANPTLAIIDSETGKFKTYTFPTPAHGGGYDDFVFTGARSQAVLISCSNPANNPNAEPAIVRLGKLAGDKVKSVSEVLAGNAQAFDIPTQATVALNMQDPDSMTLDPYGDIVQDSQADHELVIVRPASETPNVLRLPLTLNNASVEINDTMFVTSTSGTIYLTDRDGETIYSLSKPFFPPNEVYVAADANNAVGLLDMNTGAISPVVTGLVGPQGLTFAPDPPVQSGHR